MYLFALRILLVAVLQINVFLPIVISPGEKPPDMTEGMEWKSINVLLWGNWYDAEGTRMHAESVLDRLVNLGVNSVGYTFPIYQDNWQSTEVFRGELTPSNERLAIWIEEAHERNLKVMFRPLMDEQSLRVTGDWRGSLEPVDLQEWFNSYTSLLVELAAFAQTQNVELFNIGSEFTSLQGETELWTSLIHSVREVYKGQLVYSANWPHTKNVGFWNELDYIGIDAFYELEAPANATTDELVEAWQEWIDRIQEYHGEQDKPILFTEIGTPSVAGSYQRPWVSNPVGEVSQKDQATYYEASCKIASLIPLEGLFWWAVASELPHPDYDPAKDRSYVPWGKEAEQEIQQCYKGVTLP